LALKNNFNQHRATFPLTTTPPPWFYEFNRSYQSTGYDPNAPVCDAPRDASYTNGNPESEYYKCHSGELYYTFGNVFRQQLPDREGLDGSFARLMVDQWTAFARTCNPNPDIGYFAFEGLLEHHRRSEKGGEVGSGYSGKPYTDLLHPIVLRKSSSAYKLPWLLLC
jgi:hypothetical protein